jgi:hypothetical protein
MEENTQVTQAEQVVTPQAVETQAAPVAEKAPEAPPPVDEEVKAHERFIAAAKREKALRAQERALKEQSSEVAKLKAAHDRVKTDPLAALEELGLTYEQITNLILDRDAPAKEPTAAELAQKMVRDELAKYQEDARKAQAEEQTRNYERTVQSVKSQVADIAAKAGETYELVHALGATDRVWAHIEETFERTGKALPIEQAIADVEAELEQDLKQRVLGLKKVARLVAPPQPAKSAPQRASTLTNQTSSEAGTFQAEAFRDDNDAIEKIAKRLVWK